MALRNRINSRVSKIRKSGILPERRILYFHSQLDDIIDWAIDNSDRLRNMLNELPGMKSARNANAKQLKDAKLLMDLRAYETQAKASRAQEAQIVPPCLYLADFHIYELNARHTAYIEYFLSNFPSSVLLISSPVVMIPKGFEDRIELIDAIQIDQEDVVEMLVKELKNEDTLCTLTVRDESVIELANRFKGLSQRQIKDVLNLVMEECDVVCELSDACVRNEKLKQACKEATNRYIWQIKQSISEKDGSLFYIDVSKTTTAVGMDEYEAWIRRRIVAFRNGYPNAPRAVVFVGVQGSGKTLMAKRSANLLGSELVRFNLSMVKTRNFGGTEKNLRSKLSLFEAQSPLVVLIDEAEKDLPKKSESNNSHEVTQSLLGTLLSWMNDRKAPVFLFFTSNDISRINEELFRPGRVDRIFFVGMPWRDELAVILQSNLISMQKEWREHRLSFLMPDQIREMEDCSKTGRAHEGCGRIVDDLAKLMENDGRRNLFFTGADLNQLVNDAIYHLTDPEQGEKKQMPFALEELGEAMCALAKEAPVSTGERAWESIIRQYLQCANNNYTPASRETALVKVAQIGELDKQGFAQNHEYDYDRLLYERIGLGIIEERNRQINFKRQYESVRS